MNYNICNYVVDKTLLDSHLISLKHYDAVEELVPNKDITVKLFTEKKPDGYVFYDCHIDDTDKLRLNIPPELVYWIQRTFPFSAAYYSVNGEVDHHKMINRIEDLNKALRHEKKMDIPKETLLIRWVETENEKYLAIKEGFRITIENATEYLSEKALTSILPFVFSNVQNTSLSYGEHKDGKKAYIIDDTTRWMNAKQYAEEQFSHPGLYILRRKDTNGEYHYYIGKAADIKKRVVQKGDSIFHPDEKYEDNKNYDEITCISIRFDELLESFEALNDKNSTPPDNPGVPRGCSIDNALYAIEDVAIHTAAMIMLAEGKQLDNKQYRKYTSIYMNELE